MFSLITHRLNTEGQRAFGSWFQRLESLLNCQDGFRAIQAFADDADPTLRIILLEMDSEEATRRWVRGADKAAHLAQIRAWSITPYEARRLRRLPKPNSHP